MLLFLLEVEKLCKEITLEKQSYVFILISIPMVRWVLTQFLVSKMKISLQTTLYKTWV